MSEETSYPRQHPARVGLTGCCPRCGQGKLFSGFLAVEGHCEVCGLDYAFADSGDGPAVFIMLIIGFIVVALALWAEVSFNPPLWLHFALWIPLTLALSLASLRFMKGLLIALQFNNDAAEGRWGRRP